MYDFLFILEIIVGKFDKNKIKKKDINLKINKLVIN